MSWATSYIEKLKGGETVKFRPRGSSMQGKIESGQLVTCEPCIDVKVGDIVLCVVKGNQYLHLVKAVQGDRVQIGNNKGKINGWTNKSKCYGVVVKVED